MTPREIKIQGKTYRYVRTREQQNVSVYQSKHAYLRMGSVRTIQSEIGKHNAFLLNGFPVPKITESGWFFDSAYYVEKSFGKEQLSKFFTRDYKKHGEISRAHFNALLSIVGQFARAQLSSATTKKFWEEFFHTIHLAILKKEAPLLAKDLERVCKKIQKEVSHFPFVVSHGDFNVHNIFSQGVIDMEHVTHAPAGYDLVTLIAHIDMFPSVAKYEYRRQYEFSEKQKQDYFFFIDTLYAHAGLPHPSLYKKEFQFCRAVWSAARMQRYPKLQAWRFGIVKDFMKYFLDKS